jgi:enediyne biosynthesis protein E4
MSIGACRFRCNYLLAIGLFFLSPLAERFVGRVATSQGQAPILLEDVTQRSGIDFEHFSGRTNKFYIIETVTAGLATFDYDNDGLIDIYFLNACDPVNPMPGPRAPTNHLFRNLGNMKFEDVTAQSGSGDLGFAVGVTAGDYDNDGDQDLFVSNFGPNVMLENNGDGTFERREFPPVDSRRRVGAGVALLDIDQDGNLDLYFANYVDFSFDTRGTRLIFGVPGAPGPLDFNPEKSTLYRNTGDGAFRDISTQSGIDSVAGPGMGIVAFDFDSDLDTDIFISNDSAANFLFENKGDSTFDELALLAGVAYDLTGAQQGTMGADVSDFDGDGDLDLVTTNYMGEIPTLYRNSGAGYFDDLGAAMGLGTASQSVKWGIGFADFDLDSWPDLFMASGHVLASISRVKDAEKFATPNYVFRNLTGKRFVDVSSTAGSALKAVDVSRGISLDDLDNDGHVDIVVLNLDDQPQLIQNATKNANHYLQLQLVGKGSNRDAVGSLVTLQLGDRKMAQAVVSGRGYQSHFGSRLTFGLGATSQPVDITIQWHGSQPQTFKALPADQFLLLIEGEPEVVRLR